MKLPATALEGRGIGRTTGRMWVWLPVRFWADMVVGLLWRAGVVV
jgi:hypothetical protein